jgi:TRAP-type C4-dicarboxylate transport system permease small subunit
MKILHSIDHAIARVVNAALVLLFMVMLVLAVTQVSLRYFFNYGIAWADIAARNLVMWVGFLGGALATQENKHFHIDILTRFLNKRFQLWFQTFSYLFAAAICYFLGQASVTFLGLDSDAKTFLDLPTFYVELIVPVGFFLMMVQFVLRAAITSVDAARGNIGQPEIGA